jgi:protein-S-isoprenylcysteine O-methyltransferase Ste14
LGARTASPAEQSGEHALALPILTPEDMMNAWINFGVLLLSVPLFLLFYSKSVGPARLAERIGERAYTLCARYRLVAAFLMCLSTLNYIVYYFLPLPIQLPRSLPWPWWVSAVIALAIAVPAGYLWYRGVRDAGEETMVPKKDHSLYGGIYRKIRHPQAVGEMPFFWVLAFLLHSPFLALFSFVWIPVFLVASLAEERDLVIRYGQAYKAYRERTGFILPRCR